MAAATLLGLSGRATAQPTPDYLFNNFISAGTLWAGTNNWVTVPALTPVTLTAGDGSIDRVLGFTSSRLQTVTGYTTTNNLGGFNVNATVFSANSNVAGGVTLTNTGVSDTLTYNTSSTSTLPSLWQTGTGRVSVRHAVAGSFGITLAGGAAGTTLQILGGGTGDVYLDTGITSTGGGASGLLINQTGTRAFNTGSVVRLGGNNSNFTGGVTLDAGNLMLSNVLNTTGAINLTAAVAATPINSLGSGTLTVNGGSVQFDPLGVSSGTSPTGITGTFQVNNAVQLNGTLTLTGVAPATAPSGGFVGIFAGAVAGPGGITVAPTNGSLNYAFTGANTFAGPVVIKPVGNTVSAVQLGTANVSTGSFTGTTAITVTGNSSFTLNNVFGAQTRLNTTTAPSLTLNRGNFNLLGNSTANVAETFAGLTLNGMGSLTVQAGSGTAQTATLTFASLNRGADGRGTLSITAQNLGSGTGNGEGIIVFTADPGGAAGGGGGAATVTRSVLPYAVANSQNLFAGISGTLSPAGTTLNATFISGGSTNNLGLVRYDSATGRLAPLNLATEYATNLYLTGNSVPAANMRLASAAAAPLASGAAGVNRPTTVNALVLDTNTTAAVQLGVSVAGSGTVTVAGGAVLTASNGATAAGNATIPGMVNLGGLDFGPATGYFHAGANLIVNSPVSGSGGVVKSLTGTVQLNGTNPFIGGLTVNAGPVIFSADANLGAAGQPITLNSGLTTALQFQPNTLFSNGNQLTVAVNRPITVGAGGGVVSTLITNSAITISGAVTGSGQFFKGGAGVLNLTGDNSAFTGNFVAGGGILTAPNDAALGSAASNLVIAGGTFAPSASFSTNRDVLVTGTSTIFTGGQNLTLNGVLTTQQPPASTFTLFKVGLGDLTLTAPATFSQAFQLGESTPVVRASAPTAAQPAGRLVLTGANGSLNQSASVFSIGGGEIVLDNASAVNQNRLGNVTLSLVGGNATLIGNASTSVNEQVGALSISNANNQYGGRLTLVTPAGSGQSTTLTATGAYSVQAAPNVGTLFVRGTNLGAGSGDRTALILPSNPTATGGLIPSIVVATNDADADATTFATTATVTNAAPNANQFSVVPFTAYTAGGALGAGAVGSTYDVTTATTFSGASNANALRIQGGGSVDLNAGTLTLAAGNILTTAGANGGITSTGGTGTLAYGAGVTARFSVATGSDLTVNANITGTTGGLNKLGGGVLTLNGTVTTSTGLFGVTAGTLKYGVANALPAAAQPFINVGASLDLNGTNSTLGGLIGWGDTNIGNGTLNLTVGTTPILAYSGGLVGSGSVIKSGTGGQVLSGDSPSYTGQVSILAGSLNVNTNGALGVGTTPVLLGDTTGTTATTLTLGATVTNFAKDITVQAGGSATTRHVLAAPGGVATLAGNIAINNTLVTYTSGGITTSGIGLQFSGSSGITGGHTTQTGVISGPGGLLVFSGNWAFNGNNTYSGGTVFDTTTSTAAGAGLDSTPSTVGSTVTSGPFGTGTLTFTTGFGINLRADGGPRTIANNIRLSSTGGYFGTAGTNPLALNGAFDLQGATVAQTLHILNTAPTTIGGAIANGSGGIVKNGPGTLVLTAANTFTGNNVVNSGTLLVNGAGVVQGGTTVNGGAILGGTGIVGTTGGITLNAGGILAPGNNGAGTLTAQAGGTALTTAAGSILNFRVTDGSTPAAAGTGGSTLGTLPNPTSNTYLDITAGAAAINAGTLVVVDGTGATFTQGSVYSFQVGQAIGDLSGLSITNASQFTFIGFLADTPSLTGSAGGAIYVNFTPVPEPASVLGVLAVAGLAVRGLRRRFVAGA